MRASTHVGNRPRRDDCPWWRRLRLRVEEGAAAERIVACQKAGGYLRVVESASRLPRVGARRAAGTSAGRPGRPGPAGPAGCGRAARDPQARRCAGRARGTPGHAGSRPVLAGPSQALRGRTGAAGLQGHRRVCRSPRRHPARARSTARTGGMDAARRLGGHRSIVSSRPRSGVVQPPPPPPGPARPPPPLRRRRLDLVINEIDYDQVGADADGFVEIKNIGDCGRHARRDRARARERRRRARSTTAPTLTGSLAAGAYLVVAIEAQNGAPDGVALVDTATDALLDALSYEGAITAAVIDGQDVRPRRGNHASRRRSPTPNTLDGSLVPDPGRRRTTNDAAAGLGVHHRRRRRVPRTSRAADRYDASRARPSAPGAGALAPGETLAPAPRARAGARGSSPTARPRASRPRGPPATAQPGSLSWLQSAKRHCARELDDVVERLVQPLVGDPEVNLADARVVDDDARHRGAGRAAGGSSCAVRCRRLATSPVSSSLLARRACSRASTSRLRTDRSERRWCQVQERCAHLVRDRALCASRRPRSATPTRDRLRDPRRRVRRPAARSALRRAGSPAARRSPRRA